MWHHAESLVRPGSGCRAKAVTHFKKNKKNVMCVYLSVHVCVHVLEWLGVVGWQLVDEDIKAQTYLILRCCINPQHFKVSQHTK